MVRFASALLAPVVPLGVMLCCMLLEFRRPGSGISAGLQAKLVKNDIEKCRKNVKNYPKDCQLILVAGGN